MAVPRVLSIAFVVLALCPQAANAQGAMLVAESVSASTGSTVDVPITLSHTFATGVQAWSFGVCHDPASVSALAVAGGADFSTANGGQSPEFFLPVINAVAGSIVVAVINDADPPFDDGTLPCGVHEIHVITYMVNQPGTHPLCFCVAPPVSALEVEAGNVAHTPTTVCGDIHATSPICSAEFSVASLTGTPGTQISVPVTLTHDCPTGLESWSYGLCHDSMGLTVVSVADGAAIATANGGVPPELNMATVISGGITVSVVNDASPPFDGGTLPPGSHEINIVTYVVDADCEQLVCFCDIPPVFVAAAANGAPVETRRVCGTILPVTPPTQWIRGDCNADGGVDIADAVAALSFLFPPGPIGPTVPCENACDANDDEQLNIGDPVYTLFALFAGGPPPPTPHPTCGTDPTPGALSCLSFPPC
ncbi:MAG: hypothetical protein AAF581_01895 [Planctomycetota bacterium]